MPPAARATPSFAATRPGQPLDLAGPQRQPMIGLGPGATDGRFDHVQAIHCALCGVFRRRPHAPPIHEVGRIAEVSRTALQKVGIQREHHVGLAEIVDWVDRLAERHLRPAPSHVAMDRLVDVPFCLGQVLQQVFELFGRASARRSFRSAAAGRRRGLLRCFCMASRIAGRGLAPGARLAQVRDRLRADRGRTA